MAATATAAASVYRRLTDAHPGPSAGASTVAVDAHDIDVRRLPVVVDLPTAARLLGIDRMSAHEVVRTGQWPTPVIHLGP